MSYIQRVCQSSSLRQAAAAWRTGVTQLSAARVAMVASQRFAAAPTYSAAPAPVSGFSSSPTISTSFAASGVQSTSSSSTAVEGSDSGEAGNSLGGASHSEKLSHGSKSLRRRRKRF
ncbi:hypothetical protein Agub_g15681 [Astrephomene gubernaculifera]|uniref:Uncharacterized protein n=1 Tax=Astrephomene gubernaculifera TaxID=47775 RepID=A0AAD3E3E3_9CHLO|nr:hypothetical protein Agub_g15681 [Astrephomene gubernaculifera]